MIYSKIFPGIDAKFTGLKFPGSSCLSLRVGYLIYLFAILRAFPILCGLGEILANSSKMKVENSFSILQGKPSGPADSNILDFSKFSNYVIPLAFYPPLTTGTYSRQQFIADIVFPLEEGSEEDIVKYKFKKKMKSLPFHSLLCFSISGRANAMC